MTHSGTFFLPKAVWRFCCESIFRSGHLHLKITFCFFWWPSFCRPTSLCLPLPSLFLACFSLYFNTYFLCLALFFPSIIPPRFFCLSPWLGGSDRLISGSLGNCWLPVTLSKFWTHTPYLQLFFMTHCTPYDPHVVIHLSFACELLLSNCLIWVHVWWEGSICMVLNLIFFRKTM